MALGIANKAAWGNTGATTPLTSSAFSSTTGNLLVCGVRAGGSTTVNSVKNAAGVSFTALTAQVNGAQRVQFFYLKNITGNATDAISVAFSGSGNANNCAYFWEISGADTIAPSDVDNKGVNSAGTSPLTTSSFNTTVTDEIILVMGVQNGSAGTWAATGGYTLDSATGFNGFFGTSHLITTALQSAVTASMSFTSTGSTLAGLAVASFRAASTKGMVQSANVSSSGATTEVATFPFSNKLGNLLIAIGRVGATSLSPSLTDSAGNTWIFLQQYNILATLQFFVAYAANCKAGANAVTVHSGAGNFTTCAMIIAEFTGVVTSSPVDASNAVATGTGTTITANSLVTNASDLVLLCAANETSGNPGYTPNGGYIQVQAGINPLLAFNVPVASGTQSLSSGVGTPVTWETFASGFRLAGGIPNSLMMMGVGT